MKSTRRVLSSVLAWWLLGVGIAFSQTGPVQQNLWRLVAQEDPDGDRRITVHVGGDGESSAQFCLTRQSRVPRFLRFLEEVLK